MATTGTGASEAEKDDAIKAKCIVKFRTSGSYSGSYGFDWLRGGDSGRKGDVWYANIMGKYDSSNNFSRDIREYDKFAIREFKRHIITWKKETNDKNFIYMVPVMSLLKSKSATLTLKIEVKEKPKEIKFIYNKKFFKLNKDSILPPDVGKHTLADELTIECIEEFSSDQKIQVKAINDIGDEQLAGGLIVKANDKNHRRKINIVLIRVETNFGSGDKNPNISGREALLKKYYAQFYINANIVTKSLNLKGNTSFNTACSTPLGLNYPDATVVNRLNVEFLSANPASAGTDFSNYHKVYFFDEICGTPNESGLYGISNGIPAKEVVVLKLGLQDSTVAHELFHALGLSHSFSNNSKYTFKRDETDNIMDYSDMVGIPVIASWQFQWKLVQGNLPIDS